STDPISLSSGKEYAKTELAKVLLTHKDFPSGETPIPCEGVPSRPSAIPNPGDLSGNLILATSARLAKSTTANPLNRESGTQMRRVEPSALVSKAMGRSDRSNFISHIARSL